MNRIIFALMGLLMAAACSRDEAQEEEPAPAAPTVSLEQACDHMVELAKKASALKGTSADTAKADCLKQFQGADPEAASQKAALIMGSQSFKQAASIFGLRGPEPGQVETACRKAVSGKNERLEAAGRGMDAKTRAREMDACKKTFQSLRPESALKLYSCVVGAGNTQSLARCFEALSGASPVKPSSPSAPGRDGP